MYKKILRGVKRITDKLLKTRADQLFWQFRHYIDRDWPKAYISKKSLEHPHRKLLLERIFTHAPLENVIEVGCASGANLYLLSQKFPHAKLYGIDISKKAIESGENFLQGQGVKNISLRYGNMDVLREYKDKSIDVVFSDASMIYIGPEKIESILKEMMRVARKAVILCEQHADGKGFYNDKWVHNYRMLLERFLNRDQIFFTKIPSEIWSGDWGRYGYIINVALDAEKKR